MPKNPKQTKEGKKNSKGVVNSLALLTNKAFHVMHMLQLHILFVLYWLGMLEPALHLVWCETSQSSQGDSATSASQFPKTHLHQHKKKRPECLIQSRDKLMQAYISMLMSFLPSNQHGQSATLPVGNLLRYAGFFSCIV